ncbi:hypothetical protein [Nostoc sp. CALU 1950]|uniref:hypothetical protein n=1 Tax=Nostoc sp. CALU 1950 TaxID=3104321 RepID=UPI003EC06D78
MPKFYIHRVEKIPTAVHPFVKQTAVLQDKHKPSLLQGRIIQDIQNIAISMYRVIYIALAPLIVSIESGGRLRHRASNSGRAAMSKPLDQLRGCFKSGWL